jgi:hypothetical protein
VSIAPPGAPYVPGSIPCPRCASTVGPDQEWCLSCGAPARTRLVPTPNWRAPVALLALVLVLAGIVLALAFVSLTNDKEPAAPANSQAPPPSATGGQPAPAQPAPTTAAPTATPTTAPTTGQTTSTESTGTATGRTGGGTSAGQSGQSTATGQTGASTSTGQTTGTGTATSPGG